MDQLEKYRKEILWGSVMGYLSGGVGARLGGSAFCVWLGLLSECVPGAGFVSVSYRRLQKMSGLGSRATVSRAISELCAKGYVEEITSARQNNHARVYRMLTRPWEDGLGWSMSFLEDASRLGDGICEVLEGE